MTCKEEIHVGDIGTVFRLTVKECDTVVNVSSANTIQIIFVKPDGTKLTKTATFYTDGTDGIIQYSTVSGDLDMPGLWRLQAYIVFPTTEFKTNIYTFNVYRNL